MSNIKVGTLVLIKKSVNPELIGKVGEVVSSRLSLVRWGKGFTEERIEGYRVIVPSKKNTYALKPSEIIPINDPDVNVSDVTTKVKEKDNVVPSLSAS